MTTISKEEYEELKALDDKWKWIARDENTRFVNIFEEKPYKDNPIWMWRRNSYVGRIESDMSLFQFIQWSDLKPYNIAELIEEYESEETEVKSKKELIEKWESAIESAEFYGKGKEERLISYMKDFVSDLNQLDEPEVKQLYEKIRELETFNDELIRDNNQFRNELDNQEVLSEEWIDKNKKYGGVHDIGYYIPVDKLYGKIVSKQEVTIDKEDAENIVQYKELGWTLSHLINDYGEDARHDELLAKAWLAYPNIEVEEEQKYIVSDNSSIPLLIKNDSGKIVSYDSQIAYNNSNGTIELTEQEIKSYDERYMTFAKPVEGIEK